MMRAMTTLHVDNPYTLETACEVPLADWNEIDRLLAKCGTSKSKILAATIWVTDIRNRAPMNEIWTAWCDAKNMPARACIEAKLADPRGLVEIMVTAAK